MGSLIYRNYPHDQNARTSPEDLDKALQSVQDGKNVLESEYNRFTKMKITLGTERVHNMEQQYQNAKSELSNFELDIYLNAPDKYHDAVEKFRKAMEAEPDNYIVHIAYAQLLEASDMSAAIEIYDKAISIDDSKTIAYFNLGAIYVNRAADLSKAANEQEDLDEANKISQESLDYLSKAKPYMEKALATSPGDLSIINALLQICINLKEMEDYKKYKEMKKQIQGN